MTETTAITGDLAFYLKRLRLPRVGEHLARVAQQAAEEDWSYEEFLTTLLEAEVFARDQAALERRIQAARFPSRSKTLENFDFTFQTSVKKQVLLHLASLRFVGLGHNAIFLGPPGTGKTHLSIALGLQTCQVGHTVLFLSAVEAAIHSAGKVVQVTIPNQGAFNIKWYTFTPVVLVHFWIVDNTACHCRSRVFSRRSHHRGLCDQAGPDL